MTTKKKTKKSKHKLIDSYKVHVFWAVSAAVLITGGLFAAVTVNRSLKPPDDPYIESFRAQPFNRVHPHAKPKSSPSGLTPSMVKKAYNLDTSKAKGTIAIVIAYDDPNIENDLAVFSKQFGLPACTKKNGCLEVHKMGPKIKTSPDWALEASLDVEWAHAIAPSAKILLVEARSNSGIDLLSAVDFARLRKDVVAVSMSWGGDEFPTEVRYESYFTSKTGAVFFASSGDNGHGLSWPAVSLNVISVGGTTLKTDKKGNFVSEAAWSGSGGGVSTYVAQPSYQIALGLTSVNGRRAVPDVSYNADPNTGYPVYSSIANNGAKGWFLVGGTSAGAPQWAAIKTASKALTATQLYVTAAKPSQTSLRDITVGTNGTCGILCNTNSGYDYVTGLGSPLSTNF